ncbi:heme biosynthesis protein HemY [Methylocella sp.]|uniref:heme biosynthesis protein HemY n=1 Tax=Methylocella sp. TaxID=1978226 RepID=UPI003784187E
MIRVLIFLAVLVALAVGEAWLIEHPGELHFRWYGYTVETSVLMGVAVALGLAVLVSVAWALLRFVFNIPSFTTTASRLRRREKGQAAIARGMIAVAEGDAEMARRAAAAAHRKLPGDPLTLLLRAQAAQLSGDPAQAEAVFTEMAKRPDTRLLGLRGLYVEAERRGDFETAHGCAEAARELKLLPWAGKEEFDHRVAAGDWRGALVTLDKAVNGSPEENQARERRRAVLETALAIEAADARPADALSLAKSALKRAPTFEPAVALAARLTHEAGDTRKAEKLIEGAWPSTPHPELARIYFGMRPADSPEERRRRAMALAQLAPREAESKLLVARAALDAGDYSAAREAMQPLVDGPDRPAARMCRLMAELEDAEHGAAGYAREWLTRASHAPRDPIWVADGVVSSTWRPVSPVTGRLDAFEWRAPLERLPAADETEDAIFAPLPGPGEPLLLEEPEASGLELKPDSDTVSPEPGAGPAAEKPGNLADLFKTAK